MLQAMRERVMGWLGWIIIGLIIVTFALFGLGSYLQDKSKLYAAKVNGEEIPIRQLDLAYQQQRNQMEQMFGDAFNPAMIDEQALRKRALENLVTREVVLQAARKDGFSVSDQLLAAQIHAIPAFQEDGKFSEERYTRALFMEGRTPPEFEFNTRRTLLAEQLVSGLRRTDFVTDRELDELYRLQKQARSFSYLRVPYTKFVDTVQVSEEQISEYYNANKDDFVDPQAVRIAWLRLSTDDLAAEVRVDDAEVLALYEQRKESMRTAEQRRASHILIQVDADAGPEALDKASSEAEELAAKIDAGEDFAALAREHSDDPGSAVNGGDLGFFGKGVMVPEFDQAVFDMQPGEVVGPVRSQFGFHIIRLEEIRGSALPALDDVRDELEAQLKQKAADDLFYDQYEQLRDLSYENPESLDLAADALDKTISTSDWFTRDSGSGLAEDPRIRAVAFSEDVLEGEYNSEPIELAQGDVVVLRVAERRAPKQLPLEDVRAKITDLLRIEAAQQMARESGESLLQEIEQGTAPEALKDRDGVEYHQAQDVTRNDGGHPQEIIQQAFRLAAPTGGDASRSGLALANGDYAVISLTAVNNPDPANMSEDERREFERVFVNMRSSVQFATLVEELRSRAEIVIPEESQ